MTWWASYIGLPFGEGRGEVTCWGLVRAVYAAERGIDLPAYGEISARDLARVAREIKRGEAAETWQPVEVPDAFDVCLMRSGRAATVAHVGVMVDPGRVLHVEQASAAVLVPIRHYSVSGRIVGYRRYSP